jgi:hypothetical protein
LVIPFGGTLPQRAPRIAQQGVELTPRRPKLTLPSGKSLWTASSAMPCRPQMSNAHSERAALSTEAQDAGRRSARESDLPTIRAPTTNASDAELALAKARTESQRPPFDSTNLQDCCHDPVLSAASA